MKIVNFNDFLKLPRNTLYAKYEPCIFGDLCIKGETSTIAKDFYVQNIVDAIDHEDTADFVDKMTNAQKEGSSIDMNFNCQGRDGCQDERQLFAVFEKQDVLSLIRRLQRCVEQKEETCS